MCDQDLAPTESLAAAKFLAQEAGEVVSAAALPRKAFFLFPPTLQSAEPTGHHQRGPLACN